MDQFNNNGTAARPVYRPAAENGLVFGAYLSLLVVLALQVKNAPVLSLAVLLMMLCVPVVIYMFVRRGVIAAAGTARFADTALHGISTFIFGTLIMSVVMYVYLRFIDPGYVPDTMRDMVAVLSHSSDTADLDMARQLSAFLQSGNIPSAIQMVIPIAVLSIASGSVLSLIIAPIALRNNKRFGAAPPPYV